MAPAVRAVIFDLGRVLVDFDHGIAARKMAAFCGKSPEEIYALFFDSALVQEFEEGRISARDFFREVKAMLKLGIEFEDFVPAWSGIFYLTEENKKVYRIAKSLRLTHKVALLSNVNELHFDYLKKNFPVFDAFHYLFTSYELGAIKPKPQIYQAALQRLGVSAGEAFYVDDRRELIDAALALGVRAFVYKGVQQLLRDMSSCGIIASDQDRSIR